MNILKQVWECLLDSRKVTPEFEEADSSSGNFSAEEIMELEKNSVGGHLNQGILIFVEKMKPAN